MDINAEHNILDIAAQIGEKLGVNPQKFQQIIKDRIPDNNRIINDSGLMEKVLLLLRSDSEINQFETKLKSKKVLQNFQIMKERLAELQVLALIKKLEKSDTCDDVINSFLVVLNNKFEGVNNVLADSINYEGQKGGGGNISNINYYSKYLKYKLKNDKLKKLVENDY